MKINKHFYFFLFLLFFSLFTYSSALAEEGQGLIPCGTANDPCTICHFIIGIKGLIDFGRDLLITAALLGVFIAGVLYILSTGSPTMITQAKNILSASLTGFALVIMAWFIINLAIYWLAQAQTGLNVGATNWYTFTCDDTSKVTSTKPISGQSGEKCCIKTTREGDAGYGETSNCEKPTFVAKSDCETWCDGFYVNEKDKIEACKTQYCMEEKEKCPAEDYTVTDGACSTLPACGAKQTTQGVGCGQIVQAAEQMRDSGCIYNQDKRNGCSGGAKYTDCSDLAYTAYGKSSCTQPPHNTAAMFPVAEPIGDKGSLRPGDILVYRKGGEGHAMICKNDGCSLIIHASSSRGKIVDSNSDWAFRENPKVIRSSSSCSSCK